MTDVEVPNIAPDADVGAFPVAWRLYIDHARRAIVGSDILAGF